MYEKSLQCIHTDFHFNLNASNISLCAIRICNTKNSSSGVTENIVTYRFLIIILNWLFRRDNIYKYGVIIIITFSFLP